MAEASGQGAMTADVVIPTWRGRELLERCLRALAADPSEHRTIVVDNASDDGTAELVRGLFPEVTLVELPANFGFGRAVNAGVRAGDGEAIVLVNNDVFVQPGFVSAITEPLRDPTVGMVAALTLMPDNSDVIDGFGIELDVTLAAYNRLQGESMGPDGPPVGGRLAMPSGGLAAYRRDAFEAAGGFDERLFIYGEDVDLGLRLLGSGWRIEAAAAARGVHIGGATTGVGSPMQREFGGFARGFLLRRYGVLRGMAGPRALLFEFLVVGWGAVRHRSLTPLRARIRGWRAAGETENHPVPNDVIERSISAREALKRLCLRS